MPIANCIVAPECQGSSEDILQLWARESGHSSDHMTVNFLTGTQQFGNKYKIMVSLFLPSIWTGSEISSLQLGLSKALAGYFNVSENHVHVVTFIIDSGRVVEDGKEVSW